MSYGNIIGCACAGFLVDSSDYNVDGRCYVSPNQIMLPMGRIVHINKIVDGYKEISAHFDEQSIAPYGVAMRSALTPAVNISGSLSLQPFDIVSVISHGRVWVETETIQQAPTPFAHVYVTQHGFAATSGLIQVTGWSFTGDFYKTGTERNLVGIQIKQSHGHLEHEFAKKVNGVHLTRNPVGDVKYNTQVTITAEVSPKDATDKTGSWHVDDQGKGSIETINETTARFTPTRSFIGDVHITWVANDGSDVRGMVEIKYLP